MRSIFNFTYSSTGVLTDFDDNSGNNKLFQGQVAVGEYYLYVDDPDDENNWRNTDIVYINFERPDEETATFVMTHDSELGCWKYTSSNGWETDVDLSTDGGTLLVSFSAKRPSLTSGGVYTNYAPTEICDDITIYPTVGHPTVGYTHLSIAPDQEAAILATISELIGRLGGHDTDIVTLDSDKQDKLVSTLISETNTTGDVTTAILEVRAAIDDAYTEVDNKVSTAITNHKNDAAGHAHFAATNNPHSVTKTQVGLGNVDNTSDANKPVSTAQQTALNLKVDKVTGESLTPEKYTSAEKAKLAGLEGSKFKGQYISLSALQTAVPDGGIGGYAFVDAGAGHAVQKYIWDSSDSEWVLAQSEPTDYTPEQIKTLYESNEDTNAFTDAEKLLLEQLPEQIELAISGIPLATAPGAGEADGLMTSEDKGKLDDLTPADVYIYTIPTTLVIGTVYELPELTDDIEFELPTGTASGQKCEVKFSCGTTPYLFTVTGTNYTSFSLTPIASTVYSVVFKWNAQLSKWVPDVLATAV